MAIIKRSGFAKLVRADKHYIKLQRMRESGIYSVNTDQLIKELEGLHSSRASRTMKGRNMMTKKETALNMTLENQAYRSRAVQIKITCYKTRSLLDEQLDLVGKYLSTTYSAQLSIDYSTQKAKSDAVTTALADFYKLKNKLSTVMSIADMLIDDLDKTYWTIKASIDIISLQNMQEV